MAQGTEPNEEGSYTVIADASKERDRIKLVHNEQTKITATVFNNIGTAFLVGGGVAPFLGLSAAPPSPLQLALSPVWILVGFVLHLVARRILRSLK